MSEEQECIFCHIATGKIPAKKIYDDDKVTAVLDINPAVPGHILLLPKKHIAIMPQMDDDLVEHLGMIAKQLSQSIIRGLKAEGTSVFAANGAAAGQRAPHFMMHIIPRSQGDGVNLNLPVQKIAEPLMNEIFTKLSESIAQQFGKPPISQKSEEQETVPVKKKHKEELKEEAKKEIAQEKEINNSKEVSQKKEQEPVKKQKSSLDDIADFLTGGKQ